MHDRAREGQQQMWFDDVEKPSPITRKDYEAQEIELRERLLSAQARLKESKHPVLILFSGVDKAGKGTMVNLLNEWMDPRNITTRAFDTPTQGERERPDFWRFWKDLPPRGEIGLYLSAWYSRPLVDRVYKRIKKSVFREKLDEICTLENMLVDDGALIIKIWLHLDKADQKSRLESLEGDRLQRWRVKEKDWENWGRYDRFIKYSEQIVDATHSVRAPWHIVDASDPRRRNLNVGALILEAIEQRLNGVTPAPEPARPWPAPANPLLPTLDMRQQLPKADYKHQLAEAQRHLHILHRRTQAEHKSAVVVFEGWDAAGKGGAIRRILPALDARHFRIVPVAAPTKEELDHHYLWRFWNHIPRDGRVTFFDRSWYGRVLVERVEGFATDAEWQRAYREINLFEQELVEHGVIVQKFWIHITPDEQKRRFDARAITPHKSWKLTAEDWRNREKWGAYEVAVEDMLQRTHTPLAPWTVIEGNDKRFARIKVLEALRDRFELALGY
ncbi:MAG: polyphosphate:AMP phosphotransferase [Bradymonadia bacterium]